MATVYFAWRVLPLLSDILSLRVRCSAGRVIGNMRSGTPDSIVEACADYVPICRELTPCCRHGTGASVARIIADRNMIRKGVSMRLFSHAYPGAMRACPPVVLPLPKGDQWGLAQEMKRGERTGSPTLVPGASSPAPGPGCTVCRTARSDRSW
jgi:hypothetical protein